MCDDSAARRAQCAALGNAVVPDAVRMAFLALASSTSALLVGHPRADGKRYPSNGCVLCDNTVRAWRPELPRNARRLQLFFDPTVYHATHRRHVHKQRHPVLAAGVAAVRWSTPRHGGVYASKVLTEYHRLVGRGVVVGHLCSRTLPCMPRAHEGKYSGGDGMVPTKRSICDLQTQVRFERDTPTDQRTQQINAEFVEWLMDRAFPARIALRLGFPLGWTDADPERKNKA